MRACFLCAKGIPIERRHSVFCSPRCDLMYQELERRTASVERGPARQSAEGSRPREEWPGLGKGEGNFQESVGLGN